MTISDSGRAAARLISRAPSQAVETLTNYDHQVRFASEYLHRGWAPIPVLHGTKRPTLPDWPKLRLKPEDLPEVFGKEPTNIGVILGDASGGLVDIDLDCEEAVRAANILLPKTDCIFGRGTRPKSHWLYRVVAPGTRKKFSNPEPNETIVEYRANGHQTLFPGSVHPDGDTYVFDTDGEPAQVANDDLLVSVGHVAAASLLATRWGEGARHDLALAVAGTLLRAGWSQEDVEAFIEAVCFAANDDELEDRLQCVRNTAEKLARKEQTTGRPTLTSLLTGPVTRKLQEWLEVGRSIVASAKRDRTLPTVYLNGLPLSDTSNAAHFTMQSGTEARYCASDNQWFLWDGMRWVPDTTKRIVGLGIKCIRSLSDTLPPETDLEQQQRLTKWVGRSLSHARIRDMLSLAQSMCGAVPEQFDTDAWLLNCENGTLDLRTGNLRDHRREDMITRVVPVAYDPGAQCPTFVQFLSEVMGDDEGMVGYLQRVMGYSLTGDTSEDCFFILHGKGANGKSTLLNIMQSVLGPYANQAQAESLMIRKQQGPRDDIARLARTRFLVSSESDQGQRLAEGLVKQMTGGDKVTARFLYGRLFEYKPQFKLFLGTNKRPVIRGTDDGIWRRIHLIPFEVTIPPERRDKKLREKLEAERAGILAWSLQGCLQWQQMGGLEPPARVLAAGDRYRGEMDILARFIADACISHPDASTTVSELYGTYEQWCDEEGVEALLKAPFSQALSERGYERGRKAKARYWKGLRLKGLEADFLA